MKLLRAILTTLCLLLFAASATLHYLSFSTLPFISWSLPPATVSVRFDPPSQPDPYRPPEPLVVDTGTRPTRIIAAYRGRLQFHWSFGFNMPTDVTPMVPDLMNYSRKNAQQIYLDYVQQARDTWRWCPQFQSVAGLNFSPSRIAPSTIRSRTISIPLWNIMLLTSWPLPLLTFRLIRQFKTRRRLRNNLCPKCGYDLRATKSFCPECGDPARAP